MPPIENAVRQIFRLAGWDLRRRKHTYPDAHPDLRRSIREFAAADPGGFLEVMQRSREALLGVDEWLSEQAYRESAWQYGLPMGRGAVNGVEFYPTYTDLLLLLARYLPDPVRYLEIGVRVGKNLWQMVNVLSGAEVVGMDVEHINPALAARLGSGECLTEWPYTFTDYRGQRRERAATLTQYTHSDNAIHYLSADKFSDKTWEQLAGRQFNLILSDACHKPESL
ncbi:MAG: hypothetical protein ACFB51_15640, partial [Anaerolineae bacterium]